MFSFFYTVSIQLYGTLLRLASPFHPKARLATQGREGLLLKIRKSVSGNKAPVAWFHAASLGEFEQGRPVMEAFREQYPNFKILLTFFSPSGYEVRKNYAGADYIFYLPLDTPNNARQFLDAVKPTIAFFIKYEFWNNYLSELHRRHVPIISFSAIFRPSQAFFKPWGGSYRKLLTYFNHILVQNEESEQLLRSIGIRAVTRAGDTRFDRVAQLVANKKPIQIAETFKNNTPLLVVGSAWQADMDVLIPALNAFDKPLKVIIAPHEIHDAEIEKWRSQLSGKSVRYSEFKEQHSQTDRVLIIDNIGMLTSLYQYGDFAYVGGAFGKGLHNILEPATFGMPLFFGPTYGKFQEAIDLVRLGAAFPVKGSDEFRQFFEKVYTDTQAHKQASTVAEQYVSSGTGATAKVMKIVESMVLSK